MGAVGQAENFSLLTSPMFFTIIHTASSYSLQEIPVKLQLRMIIFNAFFVFLLLVAVFFPILALGQNMVADFWRTSWPLGVVMLGLPLAMNVVFLANRRFFALLERGDWPALADYLEKKVFQDGRYTSRYVRILAQSWLAMGNFDGVVQLAQKTAAVKPRLVEANALIFGAAYILGGYNASAVDFYRERLEKGCPPKDTGWVRWYYGLSLTLTGRFEEAGPIFEELAAGMQDILVAGLSSFFLSKVMHEAEEGRNRVRNAVMNIDEWNNKTAKLKEKVHGAIIRKYLDDAGLWIFEKGSV
jgi:tetratricopeptide (TPR) repeat protein